MRRSLSRRDATYLGFSLLIFILIAITFVNLFVYPLRASNPNFSDVERVFSRLEFPADWKEIDSSENSGWYGRVCPAFESDGCFNKGKTFNVPVGTSDDTIKEVFKTSGCPSVSITRPNQSTATRYGDVECSIDGLSVSGSIREKPEGWEVSVYVST